MKLYEHLSSLSLPEKVGQLFVCGFGSPDIDEHAAQLLAEIRPGGIIYFARNCKNATQLTQLSSDLQKLACQRGVLPLLISMDQEGGSVSRLGEDFAVAPSAMALGAIDDLASTEKAAAAQADQLRAMGIHMNLAPVADVNCNPANPVIGTRSYGEDPEKVARQVEAVLRGHRKKGLLSAVKHFPGHGDTATDTHLDWAVVPHSRERLHAVELLPFRAAIAAGAEAIMSTHLLFPAYQKGDLPATFSRPILHDLLRREMGFQGIILSDCLQMQAVQKHFGTGEAAVMAVQAGCDQLYICHDWQEQKRGYLAVLEAVQDGRIALAELDEAVLRILRVKEALGLFMETKEAEGAAVASAVSGGSGDLQQRQELMRGLRARSLTLLRDRRGWLPISIGESGGARRLLILMPDPVIRLDEPGYLERGSSLAEVLQPRFGDRLEEIRYHPRHPAPGLCERIVARAAGADLVIFAAANAHLHSEQGALLRRVWDANPRLILLSLAHPYDLRVCPEIDCNLLLYEWSDSLLQLAAGVLLGELEPRGKVPVRVLD